MVLTTAEVVGFEPTEALTPRRFIPTIVAEDLGVEPSRTIIARTD